MSESESSGDDTEGVSAYWGMKFLEKLEKERKKNIHVKNINKIIESDEDVEEYLKIELKRALEDGNQLFNVLDILVKIKKELDQAKNHFVEIQVKKQLAKELGVKSSNLAFLLQFENMLTANRTWINDSKGEA